MYLSLARATSRIVWPAVAAITSPSIRIFTFSVKAMLLSLDAADIAAQATGRLFQRCRGGEAQRNLGVRLDPLGGGHLGRYMAAALARRLGNFHQVTELRHQACEALFRHQPPVY